jgi:hypothetical protein
VNRAGCVLRNRMGIERGRIRVDAAAGLHERGGDQTDDESECCNRLKVEKRFNTDARPRRRRSSNLAMPVTTVKRPREPRACESA